MGLPVPLTRTGKSAWACSPECVWGRCLRSSLLLLAAGCGGGADGKPIAPPTAPGPRPAPSPVTVTGIKATELGPDFILWTWHPAEGALRYELQVYPDGGYDWDEYDTVEPSFRVDDLTPGAAVKMRVRVGETASGRVSWPWSEFVLSETHPPPPRECSDERERAERQSRFILEWDGTPFRVDVVRDFPDFVTEADLEGLLGPVSLLADKIERQLGYPIVERGEVIPVPDGTPPGWNKDRSTYRRTCPLRRERGQIHFIYLDQVVDTPRGQAGAVADPRCGSFSIVKTEVGIGHGWPRPRHDWGGPTMHELFHVLGFAHIETNYPDRGVTMTRALDDSAATPGAQSATWADIDALRCIFSEGG